MASSFSSGGMVNLCQKGCCSRPCVQALGYQIYGAQISHLLGDFLDVQRAITPVVPIAGNKVHKLQIPRQNDVPKVQINRIIGDIKELFMEQCICLARQQT